MDDVVDKESLELFDRFIGRTLEADEVNRQLTRFARQFGARVVGAHQITCSDESERECVESFHEHFVRRLLPELKYWSRSSFRTANLGGRYEAGSLDIAEDHYSTPRAEGGTKLLVTKVSSHVSLDESALPVRYGRLDRYERDSIYCGALHAVMEGESEVPAFTEIAQLLGKDSVDRLATLRDPDVVDPIQRALFAAICHAQLQGERVVDEACTLRPNTPTVFLVVAAVTLNRTDKDLELTCARWLVDRRGGRALVGHRGLGTAPESYRVAEDGPRLTIETRG